MSVIILRKKDTGDVVLADDINALIAFLSGDIVPINADGSPTALAGSLGSEDYPFYRLHVQEIHGNVINRSGPFLPTNPSPGQVFFLTANQGANTPGIFGCVILGTWTKFADATVEIPAGAALPANPAQGEMFILTTTDPPTMYVCLTAGTWTVASGFVKRSDFETKITDVWGPVISDFLHWAGATNSGYIGFYTGAPSANNQISAVNGAEDFSGVTRMRVNKSLFPDANFITGSPTKAYNPAVGDTLYIHADNPYTPSPYLVFVVSAVVSGGAGANTYWDLTGAMTQYGGNFYPGDQAYIRITDETPGNIVVPGNQVEVDNTFLARLKALSEWAASIGSGLITFMQDNANTTYLRLIKGIIQGDNEEVTIPHDFRVDATNVDYYVQITEASKQVNIRIPASDAQSDTDLKRLLQNGAWVRIGDWLLDITTNATRAHIALSITFSFNYEALSGSAPTGSDLVEVTVIGEDTHRGEIAKQSFKLEDPSVAGKGGTEGQIWTRGTSDENATWKDNPTAAHSVVPFGALFRKVFNRTFALGLTNTNGEAVISTGNTVPAGAPAGTTDFVGLDINDSGGNSQDTDLKKINLGDWIWVKRGDNYIIAKIQHINKDAPNDVYEFWFNPSTDIVDTTINDDVGTGAGEIRFFSYEIGPEDLDADTAADAAAIKAKLATGRLQKSVAGNSDITLTDTEAAYDSIEFTGLKTGNIIITLAAKPSGVRLLRNQSTGAFTLKVKASGQADAAAVTLESGDNVILNHGGSLARFEGGGGGDGGALGVTVGTISNVGEIYTDLLTGLENDDLVLVTVEGASSDDSNNITMQTVFARFQDFSTSDRWLVIRGGTGGRRFMVKRVASGGKIQVRRAGNVATTSTIRGYKLTGGGAAGNDGRDSYRGIWAANTSYQVGDIVTRSASDSTLYSCITANSDAAFTASKWQTLGNSVAPRPTAANAYTAAHTFAAGDIGKFIGVHATSQIDLSLAGSLGSVGDRIVMSLRTQGNYLIRVKWVDGTLKVFNALGLSTLTAAGTVELISNGGNRAQIYTAVKTGATEWILYDGVWQ